MEKEKLFAAIAENVVEMEDETVEELCQQALDEGIDAAETINEGLIPGMDKVGDLYESGEYCIVEQGTAYGLSIYDHVVLDSKSVKEEEIIY